FFEPQFTFFNVRKSVSKHCSVRRCHCIFQSVFLNLSVRAFDRSNQKYIAERIICIGCYIQKINYTTSAYLWLRTQNSLCCLCAKISRLICSSETLVFYHCKIL